MQLIQCCEFAENVVRVYNGNYIVNNVRRGSARLDIRIDYSSAVTNSLTIIPIRHNMLSA